MPSGRQPTPRPAHAKAPRPSSRKTDYTLGHSGRQVRVGPVTFWIAVGSLVIMAGWSLATGTYFAFHDDVLTRLIARQKEQQFAYEDRIAELRAQVDRITSRQLLNQEQFDQKLEQIMRRQSMLENRATTLSSVPDPTPTGSIGRNRPAPLAEPQSDDRAKASPISDTVIFTAPPDREARLESRELPQAAPKRLAAAPSKPAAGVEGMLARLQTSLDRVEARQTTALNAMEERYDSKAKRIRGVLADLGMDGKKLGAPPPPPAVGGPYVPLTLRKDAGVFERQLYRVHVSRADVDRLTRTLGAVPVRKPITGDIDLSSGFGVRPDPFLGRPAMHSGLDFRSETGEPGARHRQRHGRDRGLERRLRQAGRDRSRQRLLDPLRPSLGDRREGRPADQDRPDHRQGRLDRPLDRTASALRNAHRRRRGRSAEVPARGPSSRQRAVTRAAWSNRISNKKIGRQTCRPSF